MINVKKERPYLDCISRRLNFYIKKNVKGDYHKMIINSSSKFLESYFPQLLSERNFLCMHAIASSNSTLFAKKYLALFVWYEFSVLFLE